MLNIEKFKAEISNKGVLKTNRFLVKFRMPNYLIPKYGTNGTQQLELRCEAAQLPGMQFATIDGPPRLGYGPIESTPYGVVFEDMSLTFIVDANSSVYKLLYDWTNAIVNYNNQGYITPSGARGTVSGMKTYEVGYKYDYSTDITVVMYDGVKPSGGGEETPVLQSVAYNAFPKGLPSVDLAWEANDQYVKLTIPFSYTDYNVIYPK